MTNRNLSPLERTKINRTSLLLLGVGFGCALVIYFTAKPEAVDPMVGGMLSRKKYLHELRVIGGNANVMLAEFTDWFRSRWQGKTLAGTVAVITVVITMMFRWVAARPDIYTSPAAVDRLPPPSSV